MSDTAVATVLSRIANPETIKLDQRLQRYAYELPFGGEHEGMSLEFGVAPPKSKLGKSHIVLETDYGYCGIDNYRTLFQALLGIPFAKLDPEELVRKFILFLPSAPPEFLRIFGRITPNIYAESSASDYLLRARLVAADCSVSFNMASTEEFWQQVLSDPSMSQHKVDSASKKEIFPGVLVPLGSVTVGSKALSSLDVGDVLQLDNCLFDTSGQGSINLGADTLAVKWQSRGITDNFSVTGREIEHAN